MRITVVGCSGTLPGPDSPCSAYLVQHDGFNLLLDAGPGSVGALQRTIGLLDLDAVVLSHLHPDHWLDMVCYTYARRYHPGGRPPPLPVWAPSGSSERLRAPFADGPPDLLQEIYQFHRLDGKPTDIGPFRLTYTRTNHPVECYAMRVESGDASFVYSADTGESTDLVSLARDTNLFICEAAFGVQREFPPDLHLSGRQAGQHARRADSEQLVVTHLMPWADKDATLHEAQQAYDGKALLARAGAAYEL